MSEPALTAVVELIAKATIDPEAQRYLLNDIALKVALQGDPVPGGQQPVSLSGNIEADLAEQFVKFRDLHLIIGAIASRLHPDEWDAEAKPVGGENAEESPSEAAETDESAGSEPAERETAAASTDA